VLTEVSPWIRAEMVCRRLGVCLLVDDQRNDGEVVGRTGFTSRAIPDHIVGAITIAIISCVDDAIRKTERSRFF